MVGCALWFLNYSTWDGVHGIYLEDLFVRADHRGSAPAGAMTCAKSPDLAVPSSCAHPRYGGPRGVRPDGR